MDKLRMQSSNGVEDNITKIAQLFPDCVTETVDERSGLPKHLIDFEKLKQNLSDSVMSERAERYQFTWPDKSKAILLANSPINATLRPCREDSVDFDNTQNLYIEGDNLDVLKCLKETYLHKVKMIYIDPPYNTGNDFVYEDDFAQSSEEYLANSGQFDEQGNRMFTNAESNGRFHTDWLNMIYPRLKVARDLLTDDGVIFISIDDNEVENLRKVCDEVFGEQNFVDCLHWKKKKQPSFLAKHTAKVMEYVIVYAKNTFKLEKLSVEKVSDSNKKVININNKVSSRIFKPGVRVKSEEQTGIIKAGVYTGRSMDVEYKNDIYYENGRTTNEVEVVSKFSDSQSNIDTFIQKDLLYITKNFLLRRDVGEEAAEKRKSITDLLLNDFGDNQESDKEFLELFDKKYFDYTKPIKLIYNLVKSNFTEEGIILDFFSGSATTAHAVMQLNSEDGGNRKFIMVQLPEKTDEKNEAFKAGYKNICEIGKERIRRAGKKIKEESPLTTQDLDTGFRVLKLDSTNMQDIYYSPKDISQADLFSQVDNVKPDRTGEDLLFQVMLELGATLDSKIETTTVAGKTIYNVAEGYLVACFDPDVTDDVVKSIAQMQPAYAVLRDTSMKDDSTATNFEQIFKTYSPDTVTKIL
ncbi:MULTISPECIES: site-specific DNA-methyltransferase [Segatella]|jgi:adenine-specific DNA-methyltransferase|uniref:site-specific DNA-methyltransferase (adenine-specific) n=1 Tax=Segatella copri TaxID=165179 RepID=A0AA92W0I0_9BACT|nr:site-specific DNA-methyltransferase [Segatella copri]HAH90619.1 site-specific DNA-methyltransferase [Prevotella sp.]MBW0046182.1 site-specific DNA-methyltransferase [Segatella copri]MCW4124882.1 site-specific DNA-methyltransferase [Segatella copri]MCW4135815.1 site-specific DNA-methyltransferase [Segatella copri]RGN09985.1 site-specific DNA-methyltransferase [Segatella copri]